MGLTLLLGGARSGKSALAQRLAGRWGGPVTVVATGQARDAEMAARIARHRAERPRDWRTVEAPTALASTLATLETEADVVVVDCLNLWVSNLLHERPDLSDADLAAETDQLQRVIRAARYALILVSNEVGWSIHPETALGRRFRDALGLVNQAAARAVDEVVLMVAGCPMVVKSPDAAGGRGAVSP
jgi:adenosylcobinamide kinase/adenosylcobinamide-phosphate guanylyltransferase